MNALHAVAQGQEAHPVVRIRQDGTLFRRLLAFIGPGFLVAVGYMDPGNWATSIAGGSAFGYQLLFAILLSSLMAMLLQAMTARLGIVADADLAQLCRRHCPRPVSHCLWALAEVAIIATDLAELIGTAIALQLLFGIPLLIGVILTALDALLILWLQNRGVRTLEAFVIALIVLITACFAIEIVLSSPDWGQLIRGYLPTADIVRRPEMLYLAIGIVGATVMPHNLYLHAAIVRWRRPGKGDEAMRQTIRFATADSTIALVLALLINSAILILAAAAFHSTGRTDVAEIQDAYLLLAPILGVGAASIIFGIALLASGINSTVTATLAGQIIMEGFLNFRIQPWLRRLITRLIAIVPAVIVTAYWGERGTADLLIFSQVILSLQLPFAVVPLLIFVGSRRIMRNFRAPAWMLVLGWSSAAVVIAINVKLLIDFFAWA